MICLWIAGGLLSLLVLAAVGLIALVAKVNSFGPPSIEENPPG